MSIEEKKQAVLDKLNELFSDTTVSKRTTLEALEEIESELETKIDCLDADIENEEESGIKE